MKRTTNTPTIPLLLIGMTAILSILLLLYIHVISKSTSQKYVPWVDASIEIKLETALAHLWFEEILSGDSVRSIDSVYHHITMAKWYATAILDGGKNDQGTYYPLKNTELRAKVNKLLYSLQKFHNTTTVRYQFPDKNSKSDQQFDALFIQIMEDADLLEIELKQHIASENHSQNALLFMLFIAICTMCFISAYSVWRFTDNRTRYLKQLSSAHNQISEQYTQLKTLAHTDQLTGIPNRKMLETFANQALSKVNRGDKWLSVTFIDLDFFKPINDQFGHNVGDKVLVNFTKAIKAQLREGDILSRLAGDEFILLIEADSETQLHESLNRIISRVQQQLLQPILTTPVDIHVRYSAGSAVAPTNSTDFETLVHYADIAMYDSKKNGRGQHHYYSETNSYQEELALEITKPEAGAASL
ncbi:GGDEF domain-containing protein [Neptuniibacter sp. 1_MG-2023]|uniref:GGDEF domain-containing protein n=1 Tax=Neptuniibacter sp. 1_MG-2023 TaxID=3062662 RepID=UPI0026E47A71|nr:GGDEF domain-containing protein [Neptuniibacter sp. 1_MG-2023]MDO6594851.1 GGDEF domain-containing protein [Neptuniibacter sp. 1_MG-2023]